MPKKTPLPDYETDQMMELIRQHIHNILDRKMLVWRLIHGYTFSQITEMVWEKEGIKFEEKTVRNRIHKGEEIVFRHIPG